MKIGIVCPYNIFRSGGVQECTFALQKELQKRGHEVYIITPTPRDVPNELPPNLLLLGSSTAVKSFHTTAQVSVSVNTDVLDKALDDHKFDILHFQEPWVPILSRQILSRSSSKNVATFHAKLPDTFMSRTIERVITPYTRSILKNLNYLTAVSSSAASYVHNLTPRDVAIIPNGIDLTEYKQQPPVITEYKEILYIGRLEKRKGVKYLLEAYKELETKHDDTKLIIAGTGPDQEKLISSAQELGIKRIEFLGYVDQTKKLELLARARVFCSPARYGESFGIVLLEAMACGVPIVAGNNPGYIDVMTGRGELSIVDPKATSDFASRLNLLMYDEELRLIWLKWAQEHVKNFSYTRIVDSYEKLYLLASKTK